MCRYGSENLVKRGCYLRVSNINETKDYLMAVLTLPLWGWGWWCGVQQGRLGLTIRPFDLRKFLHSFVLTQFFATLLQLYFPSLLPSLVFSGVTLLPALFPSSNQLPSSLLLQFPLKLHKILVWDLHMLGNIPFLGYYNSGEYCQPVLSSPTILLQCSPKKPGQCF